MMQEDRVVMTLFCDVASCWAAVFSTSSSLKTEKHELSNMTNVATKLCKSWGQQERIFSDYISEEN